MSVHVTTAGISSYEYEDEVASADALSILTTNDILAIGHSWKSLAGLYTQLSNDKLSLQHTVKSSQHATNGNAIELGSLPADMLKCVDVLMKHNLAERLVEWMVYDACNDRLNELLDTVWLPLCSTADAELTQLASAVQRTFDWLTTLQAIIAHCTNTALSTSSTNVQVKRRASKIRDKQIYASGVGLEQCLQLTLYTTLPTMLRGAAMNVSQQQSGGAAVQPQHMWQRLFDSRFGQYRAAEAAEPAESADTALSEPQSQLLLQQVHHLQCFEPLEASWSQPILSAIAERCEQCSGEFATPMLANVLQWLSSTIRPYITSLVQHGADSDQYVFRWMSRLTSYTLLQFYHQRCDDLFNMIIDYPDSLPAILDLRTASKQLDSSITTADASAASTHRQYLINHLLSAVQSRLLHPGASTSDIITTYLSLVRVLRILDPTSNLLLLENVQPAIRSYLRTRNDTVNNIVVRLTGGQHEINTSDWQEAADLHQELQDNINLITAGELPATIGMTVDSSLQSFSTLHADDSDCDDEPTVDLRPNDPNSHLEQWLPDPPQADWNIRCARKHAITSIALKQDSIVNDGTAAVADVLPPVDIISLLIDIYGSKDTYLEEYRALVAQRLLNKRDYNVDDDITQLELLKLRFGEQQLIPVEVMLRDIDGSKRINTQIVSDLSATVTADTADAPARLLEAVLLSNEFWPTADSDDPTDEVEFTLPAEIEAQLKQYTSCYENRKKPRSLRWQNHLGLVDVELTFDDDRQVNVTVKPLHAAFIYALQHLSSTATPVLLSAVAEALSVDDAASLKPVVNYWHSQQVLYEQARTADDDDDEAITELHLIEDLAQYEQLHGSSNNDDEVSDRKQSTARRFNTPNDEAITTYILGSLNNNAQHTAERLHNMLKLFAVSDMNFTDTLAELEVRLQRLIQDGLLQDNHGLYSKASSGGGS